MNANSPDLLQPKGITRRQALKKGLYGLAAVFGTASTITQLIRDEANDYLRADRVLDWEETTLLKILDTDKVSAKERQFWSEFLSAIVYVESEGKHYISSDIEAIGLTQLTDATAKSTANKHGISKFNLKIGWDNLRIGRFHLQDLMARFGIDISVLAYYAGFTFANQRVQAALRILDERRKITLQTTA